jgi:hypothetical protein
MVVSSCLANARQWVMADVAAIPQIVGRGSRHGREEEKEKKKAELHNGLRKKMKEEKVRRGKGLQARDIGSWQGPGDNRWSDQDPSRLKPSRLGLPHYEHFAHCTTWYNGFDIIVSRRLQGQFSKLSRFHARRAGLRHNMQHQGGPRRGKRANVLCAATCTWLEWNPSASATPTAAWRAPCKQPPETSPRSVMLFILSMLSSYARHRDELPQPT